MKYKHIALVIVLMLSIVAFVPFSGVSHNELRNLSRVPASAPAVLSAPALISPANGSTVGVGNVTFAWRPVPGAVRYHLQAGSGQAFDQQYNIIERWSLTDTSYTFNVTPGFITYFPRLYWRVQAIDANNVPGPWSEVWYFNLRKP